MSVVRVILIIAGAKVVVVALSPLVEPRELCPGLERNCNLSHLEPHFHQFHGLCVYRRCQNLSHKSRFDR